LEDLAQRSFFRGQNQASAAMGGLRFADPGVPQFAHGGAALFFIGRDLKKSQTAEKIPA
jgi:hypothetical protein